MLHNEIFTIPARHLQAVTHLRNRWLLLERLEEHGFLRVNYQVTLSFEATYRIPNTNASFQTSGELFLVRRSKSFIWNIQ